MAWNFELGVSGLNDNLSASKSAKFRLFLVDRSGLRRLDGSIGA